eukprot:m.177454 g.177454  ORF g.177454 m.177454 type:complete len:341 (-) comp17965_c0_seq4:87-1109(-)
MDTATASDAAASAAVAVEGLLAEFEPGRVLAHPADGLTYAVLGSVASAVTQHTAAGASTAVAGATSPGGGGAGGGNDQAVVVVKSLRPNKKDIAGVISQAAAGTCSIDVSAVNQEYTFADVTVPAFPSRFGVTIVCPCLPHHVEKFTDTPRVLFRETRAVYERCTLPWIESQPADKVQWLVNMLEQTKEQDRLLFQRPQFLLYAYQPAETVDPHKTPLHLLCLFRDLALRTIRDLRGCHIELLRAFRADLYEHAREQWSLRPERMRVFFHYHPTFTALHCHVTDLSDNCPTKLKDVLLDDVIDNLEADGAHYENATLPVMLRETSPVWTSYNQMKQSARE